MRLPSRRWVALIGWLVAGPAGAASFDGAALVGPCAGEPDCEAEALSELRAATTDDAFQWAFGSPGLTPGVPRGPGLVVELAAHSLARPLAAGPSLPPGLPALALGGVVGSGVRLGFGAFGGGWPVAPGEADTGAAVGGRVGLAIGAPRSGRWVGLDLDAAWAASERAAIARAGDAAIGGGIRHLLLGAETVLVADIDRTSFLTLRLGGRWARSDLRATGGGTARGEGIEPRATLGAGYRPLPDLWVGASARAGLREAVPGLPRVPWSVGLSVGARVGPREEVAPEPPPAVVVPAPAPVVLPVIAVVSHPDLACGDERLATGDPPPGGTEAWCVLITDDGRVVRDGPYLRWHPTGTLAERGQHVAGQRSGTWVTLDPEGRVRSEGAYVDDERSGRWVGYHADGTLDFEGAYVAGREDGEWVYRGPDGSKVVGTWVRGQREGRWLDVGPNGRVTRERMYREGRLVYSLMK